MARVVTADRLPKVDYKNRLTVIAIGWTRGNKKALVTNYSNTMRKV